MAEAFTVTGLHHEYADCYFDAGTLALSYGEIVMVGSMMVSATETETTTFSASTPLTGTASVVFTIALDAGTPVMQGSAESSTLPPYGMCPPTGADV